MAMTASQIQADLDAVSAAIRARIAGGQLTSYSLPGGHSAQMFSLSELRAWRKDLMRELNRVRGKGSFVFDTSRGTNPAFED